MFVTPAVGDLTAEYEVLDGSRLAGLTLCSDPGDKRGFRETGYRL
jgi:hypothetical protein